MCKGILAQSFSWKKLGNQKPTGNTVCNARRTTLCWMRARWTNIYLSKLLCICPSLLEKKISTKRDIASTEISYQFLALKVPLLRRNKANNSSTSTDPFSAATKTLVLCISQFQLRPAQPSPSPPRTTAGHLLVLSVPGVGHLQIWGCPGTGHLPTLSFWHARGIPIRI